MMQWLMLLRGNLFLTGMYRVAMTVLSLLKTFLLSHLYYLTSCICRAILFFGG